MYLNNKELNIYDLPFRKNMQEFNFANKKVRQGNFVFDKKLLIEPSSVILNALLKK